MSSAIDRILLGGAVVVSGLVQRKVADVDRRVVAVEQSVDRVEVAMDRALEAAPPGMPLPTGYGLQVQGPVGEELLIPVCLPPGFELASLVLVPSFLPEDARRAESHSALAADEAAFESAPPVAPAPVAPEQRMGGASLNGGVQVVFGAQPEYNVTVAPSTAPPGQPADPTPAEQRSPLPGATPPRREPALLDRYRI